MPIPNHCIECDKPITKTTSSKTIGTLIPICSNCAEKENLTEICSMCGEEDCYCDIGIYADPMTNCCTAPFTYPGFPDSDICSQCKDHAGIWEEIEDPDDKVDRLYHEDVDEIAMEKANNKSEEKDNDE